MEPTSKNPEQKDYANTLVSPFFTRAQLYAFTFPPSPDAIAKVNKGGQHDYIPHEYIRALLDRYIGSGMWELGATLHSTDKEIITKFDTRKQKDIEQIAATANVNVTLTINARDGSDKKLVYSAVGSNTQYAGAEKGYGSIIANAINSAESIGLKRAATNLGRAFGFDLKSKVSREDMPASIASIAAQMNAREAERRSQINTAANDLNGDSIAADVSAQVPTPQLDQAQAEAPLPKSVETSAATMPADGNPPIQETKRQAEPVAETAPKAVAETNDQAPIQPQATGTPTTPAAPVEWELSLVPSKFEEWLACIQTMSSRLNAMTNEREILNFVRRNDKLIKKFPILPATDGQREKNFKMRWKTILTKRYNELGINLPEDLQQAA